MPDRFPRLLDDNRVEVRIFEGSTHVLSMAECVDKIQHLHKAISLLESGKSEETK